MKTMFTLFFSFLLLQASAQLPNSGFENWTNGNPDDWLTNNITGFATPITSTTPAYAGSLSARGEVITTLSGPMEPILSNIDLTSHGTPISQSYTLFSFYFKYSVSGTSGFAVTVYLTDAGGGPVAAGGMLYTGSVTSFTQANIPIYYSGTNPVEAIVMFTIADTIGNPINVGDYFVVDELTLGFGSGVNNVVPSAASINGIWPNPAASSAKVMYSLPVASQVSFDIFGIDGKNVMTIAPEKQQAGNHMLPLDVAALPAGVYTLKMILPEANITREQKLVIAR